MVLLDKDLDSESLADRRDTVLGDGVSEVMARRTSSCSDGKCLRKMCE